MSLTLWHPEFLFNEMDLLRPLGTLPRVNHRDLLVDVKETDKDVSITADVPGISKDNVHVRAKHGVVTISVTEESEKKDEKKDDAGNVVWHSQERSKNFVSRSIRMPKTADLKAAKASLVDGVLTLTVPKLEAKDAKDDGEMIPIS
jgi:HSP20 family protein